MCHGGDEEGRRDRGQEMCRQRQHKRPLKKISLGIFFLDGVWLRGTPLAGSESRFGRREAKEVKAFSGEGTAEAKKEEEDFEGGGSFFTQSHEDEATRREQEKEKETANK